MDAVKQMLRSSLPLVLGVVVFLLVVGPRVLNPLNIAWLSAGDPAVHYLGWAFFRDAPWTFPIGLNPGYGLEFSNAIPYSDSNPLLALVFKLFSPWLPTPFQYFGIWLLICFVLQAWFSWKLLSLISNNIAIRLLGVGLFVLSPPMMERLSEHLNLVGHFLILAALYLTFNAKLERRALAWGLLLATTALVHAYLLAMITLIWLADLGGRAMQQKMSTRSAVIELGTLFVVIGLTCWQAGYFSVMAGAASAGFGLYRANLLSLFNANDSHYYWSYLFHGISDVSAGDYEGFNYLGLGVIFLLVFAVPVLIFDRIGFMRIVSKYQHLFVLLVGFAVFALSNNVGFGPINYHYALPDCVLQLANIFRSSGRMFWPVFYVIILTTIFLVVKGYERRVATVILGCALIIQLADTSAGWLPIRKTLMMKPSSTWSTTLTDPFWVEAATKYTKVRQIPTGNISPQSEMLASYASTHGLATDAVHLARIDSSAIEHAARKAMAALFSGKLEQDSLYVADDIAFRIAARTVDRQTTLLAKIDGVNVIAPGWKNCADCRRVANEINPRDLSPAK